MIVAFSSIYYVKKIQQPYNWIMYQCSFNFSGDPDKCDLQGFTALHHAAKNGQTNIVSFLVNFGCNIWALDNDHHSALDIAMLDDKVDIISLLDDAQSKQQQKNPKMVQHLREKATKEAEQNIKRMERRQREAAKHAEREERRLQEESNPDFKPPSKNIIKTLTMRLKSKKKLPTTTIGNTTFSQIAQPTRRGVGGVQRKISQKQGGQQEFGLPGDFHVSENIDGKRTLRSLAGTTGVRKGSDIMYVTNREAEPGTRKPLSGVFPGVNGVSGSSSKWKSESDLLDSGVDSIDSGGFDEEEEKPGMFSRPHFGKIAFLTKVGGTLNAMGRSVSADFLDNPDQGFDDVMNGNRESGSSESLEQNGVIDDDQNVPWNPDEVCSDDEDEETAFSDLIRFLASCDLSPYIHLFTDQDVDLSTLMTLSEEDLEELGLKLGPRRKLQKAIKTRKELLSVPTAIKDSYL